MDRNNKNQTFYIKWQLYKVNINDFVITVACAITVVTATMGSMGFEPSLEAVRGETIEGIEKLFEYVWLILKTECDDSSQNDPPF